MKPLQPVPLLNVVARPKEGDMEQVGLAFLGAALALLGALLAERWKRRHASRIAASMLVKELEFHKARLALAESADQHPEAAYDVLFPASVWSAQGSALLAGAAFRDAEPILHWYASMAVLGNVLSRRVGPDGPEISGPDRSRLQAALTAAQEAARRLAVRGILSSASAQLSPSLFEPLPAQNDELGAKKGEKGSA
jgi:hypothetical protein